MDPRDIYVDRMGSWGKASGERAFYRYTSWGIDRVDSGGKIDAVTKYDVLIRKVRYRHPAVREHRLRKVVFIAENDQEEYLR